MKKEVYLAIRYLFRGKTRHISFIGVISCIAIALGVATLIVVISVMNGFDEDLMKKLLKVNYHIRVEIEDEEILQRVKEKVEKWPQIKSACLNIETQIFIKLPNLIFPVVVRGVDFKNEKERKLFYEYLKEKEEVKGFFVGEGLKKRFYLQKELEFYPLKRDLQLKKEKIVGTFKVGLYDIDNNYIITDLERAKSLSSNYLLFLGIRLKDPFYAQAIKEEIEKRFPSVFVITWIESNYALFSALKLEKITMFIILSLIVLVASFNIFSTLTVKVVEKIKDIGILKALGFNNRSILFIFSMQGLILGFIGIFLGSFLGLSMCMLLKKYPFIKLPQQIYYLEYLPIAVKSKDIILIVCVGLFLSFLFSILASLKATKYSICDALRYE